MTKPNCYECKWRGEVPGDAHSCCNHPALEGKSDNPFGALGEMMMGKFKNAAKKLNISANRYGVHNGWFMWPANFDPVWLTNCDGFEAKNKPLDAKEVA